MKNLFLSLFLTLLVSCNNGPTMVSDTYGVYKDELLILHNKQRTSNFEYCIEHDAAAQLHADWMANNNNLSHTGENRSQVSDRLKKEWTIIGENIAYGQKTPQEVVQDWMKSPGHRSNILNRKYKQIGFGITKDKKGRLYWCVVFSD